MSSSVGIDPFVAMEIMKRANKLEKNGRKIFHMELGEPGGGAPLAVIESAKEILLNNNLHLGYTEAIGIPSLRRRISQYYEDYYKVQIDPERIVVTTGSSAGFLLGFLAAFNPGSRIGLTEPGYPAYRNIVKALGMNVVRIPTEASNKYQPDPSLLDRFMPLDGLVVASPANPTGTMLNEQNFRAIVNWAESSKVKIISDEVYHGITYDCHPTTMEQLGSNGIIVNSFSKYFGMTGWRIGWAVVPKDMVIKVERLAQNLFISPPSLSQHIALSAFNCIAELNNRVEQYSTNRDVFLKALPRAGIKKIAPSDGAFYIFADVSSITDDSSKFCERMLDDIGVAATPGIDFDTVRGKRYIRFSIAGSSSMITQAATAMSEWKAIEK